MHLRAGWSEEDFFDVYLVGISCRTLWMVVLGGDSIADELMNMASSSTPWALDLLQVARKGENLVEKELAIYF